MNRVHKYTVDYGIRDLYKMYKSEVDNPIDYGTYKQIVDEMNTELMKLVIFKNIELNLPFNLGSIFILKKKILPKLDENGNLKKFTLPVDFKKTKELWKRLYPGKTLKEIKEIPDRKYVYHQNKHTDGYKMRFNYYTKSSNLRNKTVYKFIVQRNIKRILSDALKSPEIKLNYYESQSYK